MSGPQCCANPPTLNPSSGAGHVEKVGGLDSYVSGSPDSKLAILLVSDVYGYEAPNLRKLADKIAVLIYAVVPDFFYGDPFVPDNAEKPLQVWIKDHGMDKGYEDAKPVIEALNSKAKVVVELGKSSAFIKAAVLCHPSFVTVDDIIELKVPISILGAEIDHLSPPALLKQFEDVLASKSEQYDM
uniref:Dienelactone hydrolase domain-containing protein n=1 Tax=Salix viminalis TaxID=40686 RepID=A0A6N2LVZ1_SALVM